MKCAREGRFHEIGQVLQACAPEADLLVESESVTRPLEIPEFKNKTYPATGSGITVKGRCITVGMTAQPVFIAVIMP